MDGEDAAYDWMHILTMSPPLERPTGPRASELTLTFCSSACRLTQARRSIRTSSPYNAASHHPHQPTMTDAPNPLPPVKKQLIVFDFDWSVLITWQASPAPLPL